MKRSLSLVGGALAASLLLTHSAAQAHIVMEGALKSRTPSGALPGFDDAQKMSPCDGARSAGPVYTFQPGTTITLQIGETIAHPSYFRIAFDNDGEDGFKEPKSIMPIDKTRKCPFDKDDQCGASDFCNVNDPNGARVLWDNLNPHMSGGSKWSWNVKLPDMECENCTIQVIQVMEDTVHGAYCPQGSCANSSGSLEDIYHRCINIKLKRGATNSPGATTDPVKADQGIDCSKAPISDAGVPSGDAGVPTGDAGSTSDAGASAGGGTASGGAGGTTGGGTPGAGGGTTGGSTTGGGTTGGGGVVGTPGGAAGTAGGGTTAAPGTAGGTGATAGGAPIAPTDDDDGGCSVAFGAGVPTTAAWAMVALGLGLMIRRRRLK